jgi:molecular chaperone GrpE
MMAGWPDDETVLARFREWLEEAQAEADVLADDGELLEGHPEFHSVGLLQLIEEFSALRHELKLETKSARKLEEQTVSTLEAMQRGIDAFRSVEIKEWEAAQQAAKPLIEAMINLHEALARGRTVVETARRRILEESAEQLQARLEERFRRQPWWRRWISRRLYEATQEICRRQAAEVYRAVFESLIEGYSLIQNRLKKEMDKAGIYRIECLGKPVDPNTMTVIEVVEDSTRPPSLVIEEVRPGYYWRAKVFRFAEVRAIQGQMSDGDCG